ncbi:hypothetical protein FIBSPDRAFT_870034 [Athelia psychrophila]|uniref:Uncharacterized protein n=1 Tax=Athelia psychrophila TaxID=1759441 RepID=A0A166BHJ1_9AGAM|nr:hypothetical protein FIBSPDRAFT_870034 [Fibularhizoctonia sp. CBS 109695]
MIKYASSGTVGVCLGRRLPAFVVISELFIPIVGYLHGRSLDFGHLDCRRLRYRLI